MIRLTVLLVSEDHTNDSSCFKVILANTTMWTTVVNETWSGWVTELWNTRLQTTLERGGGAFYFMAHLPHLSWEDFKSWERQYFAILSSTNLRSFFEMSQIRFTSVRQLLPTPATHKGFMKECNRLDNEQCSLLLFLGPRKKSLQRSIKAQTLKHMCSKNMK